MTSAEAVGFVLAHKELWTRENQMAEYLAKEARQRWEENNLDPNYTNKIGDIPTAKHGVDDITVLIAFFKFGKSNSKKDKE